MREVQNILCPVDFSDATARQLHFAADLCLLFNARLILHHNLEALGPGAGVGWMWAASHQGPPSEAAAEERLNALLAEVPDGIVSEARLTHGPTASSVLIVNELVNADLIILTNHGSQREDHGSITEQILERSRAAVLALHEASVDHAVPRFASPGEARQGILVPASFSETSTAAVDFAFGLARRLALDIHLLHIEPSKSHADEPATALADEERRRLRDLVPQELAERARIHVIAGDPALEIAAQAERLDVSLIVMGEHTRTSLRRWFTHDTGRAVLHRAHCPVWYVPGEAPT